MIAVTGRFNVFGYQTREYDLTPGLGVGLIVLIFFLVGKTTMGV